MVSSSLDLDCRLLLYHVSNSTNAKNSIGFLPLLGMVHACQIIECLERVPLHEVTQYVSDMYGCQVSFTRLCLPMLVNYVFNK